jgi:tRNA threonylcarbamoyladenosine biosynthesis protein TsaB
MAVRILAFDTSADLTSVAVCEGASLLAEDDSSGEGRHAEVLLPRIERCLAAAGIGLADLDAIAVGVGPGSFTGLRVGVATAKGLGLALKKPVYPVSSLHALAFAARGSVKWLVPCLDAFKGELFGAVYRDDAQGLTLEVEPFHATPTDVMARLRALDRGAELALFGAGLERYADAFPAELEPWQRLGPELDRPRAHAIASLALQALERGDIPELARVSPMYLRDSDAQLPKSPLRVS